MRGDHRYNVVLNKYTVEVSCGGIGEPKLLWKFNIIGSIETGKAHVIYPGKDIVPSEVFDVAQGGLDQLSGEINILNPVF